MWEEGFDVTHEPKNAPRAGWWNPTDSVCKYLFMMINHRTARHGVMNIMLTLLQATVGPGGFANRMDGVA